MIRQPLRTLPPHELKYYLYERSAIDAAATNQFLRQAYEELRGREPRVLREDFCGTFCIARAFVESGPERSAYGLDLDPEPLAYGRKFHLREMPRAARARLRPLRQDVATVTRPLADIAVAENYSFFVFKSAAPLVRYLASCHASLAKDGIAALALVGGPGFIQTKRETRKTKLGRSGWLRYHWQRKRYDPITCEGLFAIHFDLSDGRKLRDTFVYDWRIWSIPEVRFAMEAAGFSKTVVYWELDEPEEDGDPLYELRERGDNDWCWNAYVVGLK